MRRRGKVGDEHAGEWALRRHPIPRVFVVRPHEASSAWIAKCREIHIERVFDAPRDRAAHAVWMRLNLRGISPARIKRPNRAQDFGAPRRVSCIRADLEPVVAKRQNVVRHRQSNDIRLDPFAAKR